MEEDPNVFAYLSPATNPEDELCYQYALRTVESSKSGLRYVPRQREVPELQIGTCSRESTVSLEDHDKDQTPPYLFKEGLRLTFNPGPRAGPRYVLRTDRNSYDIVLPKLANIKRTHCYLTFDKKRQLILQDSSKKKGTIITYNGKGKEKRRDFIWILSGDEVPGTPKTSSSKSINT